MIFLLFLIYLMVSNTFFLRLWNVGISYDTFIIYAWPNKRKVNTITMLFLSFNFVDRTDKNLVSNTNRLQHRLVEFEKNDEVPTEWERNQSANQQDYEKLCRGEMDALNVGAVKSQGTLKILLYKGKSFISGSKCCFKKITMLEHLRALVYKYCHNGASKFFLLIPRRLK